MNIGGHWKRFIFCADVHGDEQDKAAVKACLDFISHWKPEIKVFGGDAFDFRALRKKADAEEKRDSMVKDYQMGSEFLKSMMPDYFLLGNHEIRLWHLAEKDNGIQSDYARKCIEEIEEFCRKQGTRILPYHKTRGILKLGKLSALHGFYCGINAARRTALAYGSSIMGHSHSIDHVTIEGNKFRMGRVAGCLASLDMEYCEANVSSLRHQHGFIVGAINQKNGEFVCEQCYKVGNTWNFEVMGL